MQINAFRTILCLSLGTALLFVAGCKKDDGRPKDMPNLHSVSITVIQDDKPLEGATVALEAVIPSQYSASGVTNSSGVAVLKTYGFTGAPAGDYVVLVTKIVAENQTEVKTPEGGTYLAGGDSYNYVDSRYRGKDTSTFNITVTEKGAKETFDVGKAVRTFLWNNPMN
jgi:hypothetical protein